MTEYADQKIREYVGRVGGNLTHMSASQRAEVLDNIESHIRMLLQKRNPVAPTRGDVDAVMAEMEPPEHYRDDDARKESRKSSYSRSRDDSDKTAVLSGMGIFILAVLSVLYFGFPHLWREAPSSPNDGQENLGPVASNAVAHPESPPTGKWMDEWEITQNIVETMANSPGHHPMGWIAGELPPDKYDNRPHWDGPGKHVGILALHPLSLHEPAKIRFTGRLDPEKSVLCVETSANIAGDGDFLLQCVVNGEKVGEYVVDASKWHTYEFDISKNLGDINNNQVEIWNAGGGKREWYFEHCYIDKIYFKTKTPGHGGDTAVLIFTNSLARSQDLHAMTLSLGQYSGHAKVEADFGLRISGIHSVSAVWPKTRIGSVFQMDFECQLTEEGEAVWWLGGPGYGNSPALGYSCRFNGVHAVLCREGKTMAETDLGKPFAPRQSFAVRVNRDRGHITVRVNEGTLFDLTDKTPLPDPLHSWIGFGSRGGSWSSGVRYRNLAIRTPGPVADAPLALIPPVSRAPLANAGDIYRMNMSDSTFSAEWWCSEPGSVRFEGKTMVLTGPNCAPECIMNRPIAGDFALDLKMEYMSNEALNFSIPLLFGQGASFDRTNNPRCQVFFPNGNGVTEIRWLRPGAEPEVLAQTPYHAPVFGKVYDLRLERVGGGLTVFVDERLLLEAMIPGGKAAGQNAVHVGVAQLYGGAKIHRLTVALVAPAEKKGSLDALRQSHEREWQRILDQYGRTVGTALLEAREKKDSSRVVDLLAEKERFDAKKTVPTSAEAKRSFRPAAEAYYESACALLERYTKNLDDLVMGETDADRLQEAQQVRAEKDKAALLLASMQVKAQQKLLPVFELDTAVFQVLEGGGIGRLKKGCTLYTDKDVTMKESPGKLVTVDYVTAPFSGCRAVCTVEGVALAIGLFDVHQQYQTDAVKAYLKKNEWTRIQEIPTFVLFYTNGADRMGEVYWKKIAKGEELSFPAGMVLCFGGNRQRE